MFRLLRLLRNDGSNGWFGLLLVSTLYFVALIERPYIMYQVFLICYHTMPAALASADAQLRSFRQTINHVPNTSTQPNIGLLMRTMCK
jgi:hypothetical protein